MEGLQARKRQEEDCRNLHNLGGMSSCDLGSIDQCQFTQDSIESFPCEREGEGGGGEGGGGGGGGGEGGGGKYEKDI